MKKLLFKFWQFCKSRFLQIILLIIAIDSWEQAIRFGNKTFKAIGTFNKNFSQNYDDDPLYMGTDVAVTAGFEGGAIAMGLVTCVCIFGVVWIEISKNKSIGN
tara:strand:- start:474 stop:782 length:309 start_codon:yes stop_codon:yes gene_type:complete